MTHNKLQYQTVKPILRSVLERLMSIKEFEPFRLVGGTSLSLRYGHRISDDIDLFTDAEYGSIDFLTLQEILRKEFEYCYGDCGNLVGFGASYFVGNSQNDCVKLDLFYTDSFIRPIEKIDSIRLSSVEDILAMKLEVISNGGRKKDFWDLHLLRDYYSLEEMLSIYKERYPYNDLQIQCIEGLTNFDNANDDPDPKCLLGKFWEIIKLDFSEWV
jgi:predicted nucleotidyltransferase component of viral defense system